jgi:nicotinamidase-related amidase
MVRDTFEHDYPITPHARAIVPKVNELTAWARRRDHPVVFACDSFLPDDFIFGGKMKPHSLRDTPGSEVASELPRAASDVILPKRRFSAFFKTDLDQTLRTWGIDTVLVCGIATHFCVLATALDALCHDFQAIIIEDAAASYKPEIHEQTLDLYRKNPLYPLLQVLSVEEVCRLVGR